MCHIANMHVIPIRQIKPPESEPKISRTIRIRDISILLRGKDMHQDLHRHNFFFVLALQKGKGEHIIDFNPYKVTNNCIFILRPGQVHELLLKAGCTGYLMEFNMEFYHVKDRGTSPMFQNAQKLHSILHYIFHEYKDQKEGYEDVIRAQLDIFYIELKRLRQHEDKSTNSPSYERERLEEFLQLVEKNISSKKQIAEYADLLHISGYQLSALTKNALGKTPSEVINEYIILESKRYLLATSDQVNQIAWHLGYEDPSYFIRFFKKHTGYSPDAFRSNSK
ncbi:MAG: helix-turn-helix transcriptional regulator [Bacteroidota bacterium]